MPSKKMAIYAPHRFGSHSYQVDNGSGYGPLVPFNPDSRTLGISFPVSNSIRIVSTFTNAVTVDRVSLSRVTEVEGLTFEFQSVVNSDYSSAIPLPNRYRHYSIPNATAAATEYELIISGLSNQRLDVRHFGLFFKAWEPVLNYTNGGDFQDSPLFDSSRSYSSSYQKISDPNRQYQISFQKEPPENIKTLNHAFKTISPDGFFLFEKDQGSVLIDDNAMCANIQPGSSSPSSCTKNSISMRIKEAYSEYG